MLRYEHQSQENEEKEPGNSWYNSLSNATGWLNPFNLAYNAGNRALITSFTLMQSFTSAAGAVCFNTPDIVKYANPYYLLCNIKNQEQYIVNALKSNCSIAIVNANCAHHPARDRILTFGSSVFGGSICDLHVLKNAMPIDPCVVDVIKSKVVSGVFGTAVDIAAVTGIACGVVTIAAVTGLIFFTCRRARNDKERAVLLEKGLESGLDSPDKTYEKISARVDELIAMEDERVNELRQALNKFEEDYRCPVTLKIMSQPATIGCGHTMDKSVCAGLSKCPLCRGDFDKSQVTVNHVKKAEIAYALIDFSQRLETIEPKSNHELRSLEIRPN